MLTLHIPLRELTVKLLFKDLVSQDFLFIFVNEGHLGISVVIAESSMFVSAVLCWRKLTGTFCVGGLIDKICIWVKSWRDVRLRNHSDQNEEGQHSH